MPDQKISQLASGTNAQAGDLFVIARSGANYSLTTAQLFNAPSATATLAALTVDTNTLFVDAANDRVGIGTNAPITPLHVAGQVHIQPSTANNALITFRHGSLATSNYIEGRANSSTVFGTANADRMTLDASGNLMLGTTSATGLFNAVGSSNGPVTLAYLSNTNTGASATARLRFDSQGGGAHIELQRTGGVLVFNVNNADRWQISNSGHLLAGADNTYDIGASAATRPRDLHLARNLVGAGWLRAGAASAGAASTTTIGGTTATTVGAAGAASALPANPLGYIVAHVGTTEVRIPYYNA